MKKKLNNNWINKTVGEGNFLLELQRINSNFNIHNQITVIKLSQDRLKAEIDLLTNKALNPNKDILNDNIILSELFEIDRDINTIKKRMKYE